MESRKLQLEVCKRSDEIYQDIRNRHYVENNGTHGQQIHFKIWNEGEVVGIISGASSVYAVESRDKFFNIPKGRDERQSLYLPAIINNTVFRLEKSSPNLGTRVLALWRKTVADLWEELYGVSPIGFETFVVEEPHRKGSMYLADNWSLVGRTKGSTKKHSTGASNPHERLMTEEKLVFCKWLNRPVTPTTPYISSWRSETEDEKNRAKRLQRRRLELIGSRYVEKRRG